MRITGYAYHTAVVVAYTFGTPGPPTHLQGNARSRRASRRIPTVQPRSCVSQPGRQLRLHSFPTRSDLAAPAARRKRARARVHARASGSRGVLDAGAARRGAGVGAARRPEQETLRLADRRIRDVACGASLAAAVTEDGEVWAWGYGVVDLPRLPTRVPTVAMLTVSPPLSSCASA